MARQARYVALVNPDDVKERMFAGEGADHLEAFRERGWRRPDELQKEVAAKLAKDLGLQLGPASKLGTIADACVRAILVPVPIGSSSTETKPKP